MTNFTQDYFTPRIKEWKKYTKHLEGKAVRGLEIGTFEGRSALWLLENVFTNPKSRLDIVDVFEVLWEDWVLQKKLDKAFERFQENIKPYLDNGQVEFFKEKSCKALPLLMMQERKYDLIYIDGSHKASDVITDAVNSWLLLKEGGIMVFDDYPWGAKRPQHHRPKPAIDLFLLAFGDQLDVLHKGWQVFVRRKS